MIVSGLRDTIEELLDEVRETPRYELDPELQVWVRLRLAEILDHLDGEWD